MKYAWILASSMLVACNVDTNGVGSGSGEDTGTETQTDGASGDSTSVGTSTVATGSMSGGSDSGGSDGVTTTSTADGTTTGPGDDTGSTTDENTTEESTTDAPGPSYPECGMDGACPADFPICDAYDFMGMSGDYCTLSCDDTADCPGPDSGDSVPYCFEFDGVSNCYLDCSFGETCPDGMDCVDAFGGGFCAWTD